jgi:hypothetical protein
VKRIYVSGPMTGMPGLNFPAFNAAAAALRGRGFEAVNPVEINPDHDAPWQQCLRQDIKALCDCDAVALLPGWQNSNGAQLELHLAHRLGLKIDTLDRWLGLA